MVQPLAHPLQHFMARVRNEAQGLMEEGVQARARLANEHLSVPFVARKGK